MCQVLVWFYSKLWICLVSSKNWRKLSVFYPLLQNVIGRSHWNSVWNLATFPVKQYKKPTALIRAIEVAFYTTKRFSSSSFHNKIPFMIHILAIGLTYQFPNFQCMHFSAFANLCRKSGFKFTKDHFVGSGATYDSYHFCGTLYSKMSSWSYLSP